MIPASRESVLDMSGSCQHITERQVHHEKESKSYLKMPHNRNGDDEWYICQCKLPMARVAAYAIDSAYKRISHTEARDYLLYYAHCHRLCPLLLYCRRRRRPCSVPKISVKL